jgi:hypothetical protein
VYNMARMSDSDRPERFIRVVGKREPPAPGCPPSPQAREAMTRMASYRMEVPKGVFIYASHEAANADWERWRQETMRMRSLVKPSHD